MLMITKDDPNRVDPPEEGSIVPWDTEKCERVLWREYILQNIPTGGHQDKPIVRAFEEYVSEDFHVDTFNLRSLVCASIKGNVEEIAKLSEAFAKDRCHRFCRNEYNCDQIRDQFDERLNPFYSPSNYSEE